MLSIGGGFLAAAGALALLGSAQLIAKPHVDSNQARSSPDARQGSRVDPLRQVATPIVGAWICIDVNMEFKSDGTGALITPGIANANAPAQRATTIDRFNYTFNGSALTLAFTEIDMAFATQDADTSNMLVQSGNASSLPDRSIRLNSHAQGMIGTVTPDAPYLVVHWTTFIKSDGNKVPTDVTATCVRKEA